MTKIELVSSKIQTMLGNNYAIFPISHFRKNYTEAKLVNEGGNVGYATYTTSEYGDFRKDKVVGILQFISAIRSNVSFYNLQTSYKMEFSVPRNIWKTNKNGQFLENPPFIFENDIETLIGSITNQTITLDSTYKAKMTMSEPVYTTTENDGEYQYDIYQVNGQIVITDKAKFGSDYSVSFYIDSKYEALDDITDYGEGYATSSNAIQKQGKAKTEQNPAQCGWSCTATIDDIVTDNKARTLIYKIIHENAEIIDANATTEALKRKIPVQVVSPHSNTHTFNAIVDIDFKTSRNGTGTYVITLTDDGA